MTGTFANPFGNGHIYFYLVHPVTMENILIGDIPGNSAALNDNGAVRTYTWEHTLEASDVAGFAPGVGALTVFGVGVNDLRAKRRIGFGNAEDGKPTPLHPEAERWFGMGLSDETKKLNTETYQGLMFEILLLM